MEAVFDTLAYARRLKRAGIPDDQAEAHADALQAVFTEGVANKSDLKTCLARLEARIGAVEARLATLQWGLGFVALFVLAITARLFGAI